MDLGCELIQSAPLSPSKLLPLRHLPLCPPRSGLPDFLHNHAMGHFFVLEFHGPIYVTLLIHAICSYHQTNNGILRDSMTTLLVPTVSLNQDEIW